MGIRFTLSFECFNTYNFKCVWGFIDFNYVFFENKVCLAFLIYFSLVYILQFICNDTSSPTVGFMLEMVFKIDKVGELLLIQESFKNCMKQESFTKLYYIVQCTVVTRINSTRFKTKSIVHNSHKHFVDICSERME